MTNLLANGDFETAGGGGADVFGSWVETASDGAIASEGTIIRNGAHSAKLTAGAGVDTCLVSAAITVVTGATYALKLWTRGNAAGRYGIYDEDNAAWIKVLTATPVLAAFGEVWHVCAIPTGCTHVTIHLYCPATNTKIAYFDLASFERVILRRSNSPARR